jgi:hypothetical protein
MGEARFRSALLILEVALPLRLSGPVRQHFFALMPSSMYSLKMESLLSCVVRLWVQLVERLKSSVKPRPGEESVEEWSGGLAGVGVRI